jgi:hypothetical protein
MSAIRRPYFNRVALRSHAFCSVAREPAGRPALPYSRPFRRARPAGRGPFSVSALYFQEPQPSMSRVGNPYDNAKAESFMKTLKQEEVGGRDYRDLNQARDAIGTFIEDVYNRQRLHSALACRPPVEFEGKLQQLAAAAQRPQAVADATSLSFRVSPQGCTPTAFHCCLQ